MGAARPRTGRLQRQVLRCFMASGPTVLTSDLAYWCWARQLSLGQPIRRSQRLHTARAARWLARCGLGIKGCSGYGSSRQE